jgi:hypothetical protein
MYKECLHNNLRTRACVAFACAAFFVPGFSHAALLYLDPSDASVYRGDTVTVSLRIDTDEGECINTVDAIVQYDPSIRAVDTSRGNSILNIWVEEPKIDETNHTITLAGGIPGGYCGRVAGDPSLTNVIAEFIFRSPGFNVGGASNPNAAITVAPESMVYLNDPFGTNISPRTEGALITLLDSAGTVNTDSWKEEVLSDNEPPADFAITLTRTDAAFSNEYFITFNSQDKQSGIDHYEVMEEPLEEFYAFTWGRADAPWERTESPYVLKDQTLNSTIRVRAIDKAGNETIAVLVPDTALRTLSHNRMMLYIISGGVFVILMTLLGVGLMLRKRRIENEQSMV